MIAIQIINCTWQVDKETLILSRVQEFLHPVHLYMLTLFYKYIHVANIHTISRCVLL